MALLRHRRALDTGGQMGYLMQCYKSRGEGWASPRLCFFITGFSLRRTNRMIAHGGAARGDRGFAATGAAQRVMR
jgi:hypothetical protein